MKTVEGTQVRDLGATTQRILRAARTEFAERGFEGARVDRIARDSNSNKSMIYYIFGGKEDLFMAVLESLFVDKTQSIDHRIATGQAGSQALPGMVGAVVDVFTRNAEAARVLIYDIAAGAPFLRKLKAKRPELFQTFGRLSDALRSMMDAGMLPRMDPDKAIVFASTVFLLLPVVLANLDLLRPAGSAAHADLTDPEAWKGFLVDILLRVMQNPPSVASPLAIVENLY